MLAIDPGSAESAFVQYSNETILGHGKLPNAEMLAMLPQLASGNSVAVEAVASYGMAVGREVFETCFMIGRLMQAALTSVSSVRLVYRAEVKSHLCKSQKANDSNIRAALIDRLGAPGTKRAPGGTFGIKGDCWSALGIAVTASETTPEPGNVRT